MNPQFKLLFIVFAFIPQFNFAQTNIQVSNQLVENILTGNYNRGDYQPTLFIKNQDSLINGLINEISNDSLFSYLRKLESFYNRNTASDTHSNNTGIGACRRWIYAKFQQFSEQNENRLITSYLDFNKSVCGMGSHKNVMAVLPGLDPTSDEILIVEGHFDTRCEGGCDTTCYTPGMDDNGSGTGLVMELARVMSKYAFNKTIVFTTTTGEDQGLHGATAFAQYCADKALLVKAVFNNDVVGGIYCGYTSSPPSCPYAGHTDSTHVRIFSYSQINDSFRNSSHKQLARYIKMNQEEKINPKLLYPLIINLMIMEDRTGRGGDHIPFRKKGYAAIRYCAANEHGNGKGILPDRTHTSTDIIGVDTTQPPDGSIDSFFVNLNYLRRNALSNGINVGLIANSPLVPNPEFIPVWTGIDILMKDKDSLFKNYRVGIRSKGSGTLYFDTVMSFTGNSKIHINKLDAGKTYFFSVANVENGISSLFSEEFSFEYKVSLKEYHEQTFSLLQNSPNPFFKTSKIKIIAEPKIENKNASIVIRDITGKIVFTERIQLHGGINTYIFTNNGEFKGLYTYSVVIGNQISQTLKMIVL